MAASSLCDKRLLLCLQYRAAKELHRQKREVYIRLHREIKAHEASVSGLLVRPGAQGSDLCAAQSVAPYRQCLTAGL